MGPVRQALNDSGLKPAPSHEAILLGRRTPRPGIPADARLTVYLALLA